MTRPTWRVPTPYGYPAAVTAGGSVGAPLLAGFTVTLIGVVIGDGSHMGAPGLALDVLSGAVVALIAAVQFSFVARAYTVTPSELRDWWPDNADDDRLSQLKDEQIEHDRNWLLWATRFRRAYNLGIVLLLTGVAVILVPPAHGHATARWIAAGIVGLGVLSEIYWIMGSWAEGLGPRWWESSRLRGRPPRR